VLWVSRGGNGNREAVDMKGKEGYPFGWNIVLQKRTSGRNIK
jgi:hypothetical protein